MSEVLARQRHGGTKVSIISSRPNTTRLRVRGVLHRDDAQVVFVDTPGIHRPRRLSVSAQQLGHMSSRTST